MRNIFRNIPIYCDRTILGFLMAVTVIIPLFFDIRIYSVFDLSKLTALYFLTIAVLAAWTLMLAFQKNPQFLQSGIDISIGTYILVFIGATALSINPLISLFGTYKRFEGLTATMCYIFLFYAIINFVTTRTRVRLMLWAILGAVCLASMYGIIQHLGLDKLQWSSFETRRVFSTFGNPVFFSAYLVMTLPIAIVYFFSHSMNQKAVTGSIKTWCIWGIFVLALIIYSTFWLTNTRACFVALLGGVTPLLFLLYKKQPADHHKFAALVIAFLVIGIFFNVRHETSVIKHFTGEIVVQEQSEEKLLEEKPEVEETQLKRSWIARLARRIASNFAPSSSTFSRIFQYFTAFEIIKDFPALGVGPDTTGIIYQRYLAKVYAVEESDGRFHFPRQDRIHNDFLDTSVTRGLLGLSTYIFVLTAFGIYVYRNYHLLRDENKLLILGLSAGILCYFFQNQFSFGNTPIVTLFWVMMGLCIAIVKTDISGTSEAATPVNSREQESSTPDENSSGRMLSKLTIGKWILCAITLGVTIYMALFVYRARRADATFEKGRRILTYGNKDEETVNNGLYYMRRAILLNPYEVFYRDEFSRICIHMVTKTKDEKWIQKAYISANNSLELIPDHFIGYFHLGMVCQLLSNQFNRNTEDISIAYYKKAIEIDPFQAPFHSNLATLYMNRGMMDQAIDELYKAYLIEQDEINHLERLANAYMQQGDLDNALKFAYKAIEKKPEEPSLYNNLGALLIKKGLHEEAISAFNKAIELAPDNLTYLENLAKLYMTLGRFEEIIPYYENLIQSDPLNADYYNNLGVAYRMNEQYDTAIQLYQKAREIEEENPLYTHNLAGVLYDQGQYVMARELLDTFNQSFPGHNYSKINLLLANLYAKEEDWERVAAESRKALEIDKDSFEAHKMLGYAYYKMQQFSSADEELTKALLLNPDNQAIKKLLTKINMELELPKIE